MHTLHKTDLQFFAQPYTEKQIIYIFIYIFVFKVRGCKQFILATFLKKNMLKVFNIENILFI